MTSSRRVSHTSMVLQLYHLFFGGLDLPTRPFCSRRFVYERLNSSRASFFGRTALVQLQFWVRTTMTQRPESSTRFAEEVLRKPALLTLRVSRGLNDGLFDPFEQRRGGRCPKMRSTLPPAAWRFSCDNDYFRFLRGARGSFLRSRLFCG